MKTYNQTIGSVISSLSSTNILTTDGEYVDLLGYDPRTACYLAEEEGEPVIGLATYDVVFDDADGSNAKGWHTTINECFDYIKKYNGTNESYFEDYKGGIVSIRCHETEETIYEEVVR